MKRDGIKRIAVLGAGIAGISAAFHAKEKYPQAQVVIYEKESTWGGLCGGFEIDSYLGKFWFDNFVHLSFTQDPYTQNTFHHSALPIRHTPNPINYYQNFWIKHPAQNNLYPLPTQIKVQAIEDMIKNTYPPPLDKEAINDFETWLKHQYGEFFAEHFPMVYTRKYWTLEAKDLSSTWVGSRLYCPNIQEVLYGAMSEDTPCTYYAQEQRYPQRGQYRSFFQSLMAQCLIHYDHQVTQIDMDTHTLSFKDKPSQSFDKLISTLPLPIVPDLLTSCPQEILTAKKDLFATSGIIISLGFNKQIPMKNLWFYIYDTDILPARVYSPSNKSPANAPKGTSSLQAEIYFSRAKEANALHKDLAHLSKPQIESYLLEHTINQFIHMGLCQREDIIATDVRTLPFANVVFTHHMEEKRQIVRDYLQQLGIISCGRFGEWEYFWSDQSFISGKKAGESIEF
ncbi:hypothetical protein BKH46_04750 [Helicobacter sp. 12S02634-8]|uniref:protoporphyrinogen/coproporphyrinogen oxidase n=1 Tax=Helicobacter sp. 12S02634-8 TaxID=1476199 RepID=UPI000BA63DF7|nr:FAD-dependent oxidoreductase [Helicobacter sp. 12S02634-8]PAF47033.1 hypothetical protein BKH46_04750 [Helicobacter sp. 12S02634-8]